MSEIGDFTEVAKLRDALEDMVFQFGYRGVRDNKPIIHTAGLSALELAFDVLGWDDPHFIEEKGNTCEVEGCAKDICCGTPAWDGLYLCLCHEHSKDLEDNKPENTNTSFVYGINSRAAIKEAIIHKDNLNKSYPLREYKIQDIRRI